MKYNTSLKTVYEVFSTENPRYVDLAIKALSKEGRVTAILTKKYGPKLDGEGGMRFLSYADDEYLKCVFRRIDSYVQAIKVLAEVYKETDEQILNRFRKQNDVQILAMMRNLSKEKTPESKILYSSKNIILTTYKVSEELLVAALDHVENLEYRRMYMYYYGIARNKMQMDVLLKVFPTYNAAGIKSALLEVQNMLPNYIKIEKEKLKNNNEESTVVKRKYTKPSTAKNTAYNSGFRYNSLFDYFFDKDDSIELRSEKREIILDYMELVEPEKVQVIKKIFGENYNQLVLNVELTKSEKYVFDILRTKIRIYLDRVLSARHNGAKKVYADDRVILTKNNGFREKLNAYFEKKRYPLAMEIFAHYIEEHKESKEYLSKFYDLDTMELRTNVYSSKNDFKKLREIVKAINSYINICSSISRAFKEKLVNYYKKPFMSEARIELIHEFIVKCINTFSEDEKTLLQKLYGEDYRTLNIYADIKADDVDKINQLIDRIGISVSNSLEIVNTFRQNIFMYFHRGGMSASYKEKIDAEIKKFIDSSSSKGKYVAVMLYGPTYSNLDPSVKLSQVQVNLFNSLLAEVTNHIESIENTIKSTRRGAKGNKNSSFLDYYIDSNASDEENKIMIDAVKKAIESDNSKYKALFLKAYKEDYTLNREVNLTNEDKVNIRFFRKQIFIKVFGSGLPKSIYDMVINGRTNEYRKNIIKEETNKFFKATGGSVKNILRRVYDSNLCLINKDVKLSNYELYLINKFNLDLNDHIMKTVPLAKNMKPIKPVIEGYVNTEHGRLPKKFFSFLSDVKTHLTEEELLKDAKSFVKNSKSKYILDVKKLYGEEVNELNESIKPTKKEVTSVRFLIRDMKARYKMQMNYETNRDVSTDFLLPANILDLFNLKYDETNKDILINRINYQMSQHDSVFSHVLRLVYGESLNEYKKPILQIKSSDLALFKTSVKVINRQFAQDLIDYELPEDLLEYIKVDTTDLNKAIKKLTDQINGFDGQKEALFKKLIKFMYDENYILVSPMPLKSHEVKAFEIIIKRLIKMNKKTVKKEPNSTRTTIKSYFFDNFLFDGEEVVPEDRKNYILKIVRGSNAVVAKLALELFGINLDKECKDLELLKSNIVKYNALIKRIKKRLTNNYGRGLFMLADNFIEQFYLETDTLEIKNAIKEYLTNYISSSHSKHLSVVKAAYDEDYNLRKDYIFDGEKRHYYAFIYSIKMAVDKYRAKLINGEITKETHKEKSKATPRKTQKLTRVKKQRKAKPIKLDMMNLGENGYLVLTNDLFDIRFIGNEEEQVIEAEITDEIIKNAYDELMDSQTIMDLLLISSNTLVDFYLRLIDELDDPTEAFNYLINLGDKDTIKRLMISPLFLRVVNCLTDKERQLIYLKLVQVSNSSLTDELIAKITELDINSIREYEIMTKDDKVNTLNNFIRKRK